MFTPASANPSVRRSCRSRSVLKAHGHGRQLPEREASVPQSRAACILVCGNEAEQELVRGTEPTWEDIDPPFGERFGDAHHLPREVLEFEDEGVHLIPPNSSRYATLQISPFASSSQGPTISQ